MAVKVDLTPFPHPLPLSAAERGRGPGGRGEVESNIVELICGRVQDRSLGLFAVFQEGFARAGSQTPRPADFAAAFITQNRRIDPK